MLRITGGAKRKKADDEDDEDGVISSPSGIVDMAQFSMNVDARDCAIVGEVMQKKLDDSSDFIDALELDKLENVQEIVWANPKHLMTDTTLRKYADLLPEMLEIRVCQRRNVCMGRVKTLFLSFQNLTF